MSSLTRAKEDDRLEQARRVTFLHSNPFTSSSFTSLPVSSGRFTELCKEGKVVEAIEMLQLDRNLCNEIDEELKTPLIHACASGSKDLVEALLFFGAHIRCTDHFGNSAVHTAFEANQKEIIDLFYDMAQTKATKAIHMDRERAAKERKDNLEKEISFYTLLYRKQLDTIGTEKDDRALTIVLPIFDTNNILQEGEKEVTLPRDDAKRALEKAIGDIEDYWLTKEEHDEKEKREESNVVENLKNRTKDFTH
eukprot:g878.t1